VYIDNVWKAERWVFGEANKLANNRWEICSRPLTKTLHRANLCYIRHIIAPCPVAQHYRPPAQAETESTPADLVIETETEKEAIGTERTGTTAETGMSGTSAMEARTGGMAVASGMSDGERGMVEETEKGRESEVGAGARNGTEGADTMSEVSHLESPGVPSS
jgi:hypothetical protein